MTTVLTRKFKLKLIRDKPDARDLVYRGTLVTLPASLNNASKVPFLLDQGEEGACTGFGLAANINFNLKPKSRTKCASTRFLYESAKDYDEYSGDAYSGSSCRGAIKGFFKQGCCYESDLPYDPADNEKRSFKVPASAYEAAVKIQLGCYFRIPNSIIYMQSALFECGILYAACDCHAGWEKTDEVGNIVYNPNAKVDSAHAFAIVGYDELGFWIQNSWKNWGIGFGKHKFGFGRLFYEDWMKNGSDCWALKIAPRVGFLINRS